MSASQESHHQARIRSRSPRIGFTFTVGVLLSQLSSPDERAASHLGLRSPFMLRNHLGALGLLALSVTACTTATADPSPSTPPPTSIAENGAVLIDPLTIENPTEEPAAIMPIPIPDPSHCFNGGPFVRLTAELYICAPPGPQRAPLFPMSLNQMIDAVGLPPIFKTTIVPRECGSPCNPAVVNDWGCIGPTQHCAKAGYYQRRGYSWPADAKLPWPHLVVTKDLYDELGLQPWTCGRCSLKS